MLSKRTLRRITALRRESRSGASDLTRRAIDILTDYLQKSRVKDNEEFVHDLRDLCGRLIFAQSAMSSIQNVCVEVLSTLSEYRNGDGLVRVRVELRKKLQKISSRITSARPRIATHLAKVVPDQARILTLSYSSTVVEVLKELKRKGKDFEVTVMESRPMFEGRITARKLLASRIRVSLIADAAMGMFSRLSDLVIVGADAIFADGSVLNKIGSYPLALSCNDAKIPFYVVADSSKLSSETPAKFPVGAKNPFELLRTPARGLEVKNFYFELTPSKYITGIITEGGVLRPPRKTKRISTGA